MKKVPFVTWLILLFIVTSIPAINLPRDRMIGYDKITHFFLYSVLTLLFFYAFGSRGWQFFLIIVVIAIIDEFHQSFIPGRLSSFYDLIADMIGGGVTFWFLKT